MLLTPPGKAAVVTPTSTAGRSESTLSVLQAEMTAAPIARPSRMGFRPRLRQRDTTAAILHAMERCATIWARRRRSVSVNPYIGFPNCAFGAKGRSEG